MTTAEIIQHIKRWCGIVQASDLEDLIFVIRSADGVIEAECTLGECSIDFIDASDATVTVDSVEDIVGVRWAASGAIVSGSLTADY